MTTTQTTSAFNNTLIKTCIVALALGFLPSHALALCDLEVGDGETYTVRGCEEYGSVCVLGNGKILISTRAVLTVLVSLSVSPTAAIEFAGQSPGPCNPPGTPGAFVVAADLTMDGTFRATDGVTGIIASDIAGDQLTISPTGVVSSADGALEISAEIINHGRITADGRDTGYDIVFTNTSVQAASSGLFEVVTCDARMIFDLTSALTFTAPANFNVEAGTLEFKEDVTTADSDEGGGLRVVLGTVEVAVNKSVRFRGKYTR